MNDENPHYRLSLLIDDAITALDEAGHGRCDDTTAVHRCLLALENAADCARRLINDKETTE